MAACDHDRNFVAGLRCWLRQGELHPSLTPCCLTSGTSKLKEQAQTSQPFPLIWPYIDRRQVSKVDVRLRWFYPVVWAVSRAGVPPWRSRNSSILVSRSSLWDGGPIIGKNERCDPPGNRTYSTALPSHFKGYVVLVGLAGRAAQVTVVHVKEHGGIHLWRG